jgi:glutathione S-transferase
VSERFEHPRVPTLPYPSHVWQSLLDSDSPNPCGDQTAEFLEKSLFGKVPLLEVNDDDDGVAIFESRAISRYLCEKYAGVGPSLIPRFGNPKSRAIWEMRLVVEATEFDVHVGPVLTEMIIRP